MIEETIKISEDEAALYDRQIRLWGLDAQKRLRASRVLLVGISGLGAEVAKNIILSGIKSMTILDPSQVTDEDFSSQFFVTREDLGNNRAESSVPRAQLLNPMVEVKADTAKIADKADDFFKAFDIVCVTCCTQSEMVRINGVCRKNQIKFYAGDVWGFYGYLFADLGEHEYAEEVQSRKRKADDAENNDSGEPDSKKSKTEEPETVTVRKTVNFVSFESALQAKWDSAEAQKKLKRTPSLYFLIQVLLSFRELHGRDPDSKNLTKDITEVAKLAQHLMDAKGVDPDKLKSQFERYCVAELSPVCAVVGGVLGQEIIKAVSQKDAPHNNFFFFDGIEGSGLVDCIGK